MHLVRSEPLAELPQASPPVQPRERLTELWQTLVEESQPLELEQDPTRSVALQPELRGSCEWPLLEPRPRSPYQRLRRRELEEVDEVVELQLRKKQHLHRRPQPCPLVESREKDPEELTHLPVQRPRPLLVEVRQVRVRRQPLVCKPLVLVRYRPPEPRPLAWRGAVRERPLVRPQHHQPLSRHDRLVHRLKSWRLRLQWPPLQLDSRLHCSLEPVLADRLGVLEREARGHAQLQTRWEPWRVAVRPVPQELLDELWVLELLRVHMPSHLRVRREHPRFAPQLDVCLRCQLDMHRPQQMGAVRLLLDGESERLCKLLPPEPHDAQRQLLSKIAKLLKKLSDHLKAKWAQRPLLNQYLEPFYPKVISEEYSLTADRKSGR